jgi:hypothetical protein
MTIAAVLSLDAKRRKAKPTCGCPRHELTALSDRFSARLAESEGSLLIPREHLTDALADLTATTARLLELTERTNP